MASQITLDPRKLAKAYEDNHLRQEEDNLQVFLSTVYGLKEYEDYHFLNEGDPESLTLLVPYYREEAERLELELGKDV